MGDTGGDTPEGRQAFRGCHLGGHVLGLDARLRQPPPRLVECGDDAVELAFARFRHLGEGLEIMAAQAGFDEGDMPAPDGGQPGDPGRDAENEGEEKREADTQPVMPWRHLNAGHRPGGHARIGPRQRAGGHKQPLRSGGGPPQHGLFGARRFLVDGFDAAAFGGGEVGFRARARIGRIGIGQRASRSRPDAALHPGLLRKGGVDHRDQVAPKPGVRLGGVGPIPAGHVKGILASDQVAGLQHHGLRLADLGDRRGVVELKQQKTHSQGGGKGQSPEHPKA